MDSHPLGWRGSSWKAWQHPDLRLPLEPTQTSQAVPNGVCPARERRNPSDSTGHAPGPWVRVLVLGHYRRWFWTGVPDLLRNCQEDLGSLDAEDCLPCLPSAPSLMCSNVHATCPVPPLLGHQACVGAPGPQGLPRCHWPGPGPCTKEPLIRWAVWPAPYLFAWEPQGGCWEPWNPGGQSLHIVTMEACTRVIKSQNSSATRALLDNSQTS